MAKLPVLSGKEAVKALSRAGFCVHHQRGSHIVLRRDEPYSRVVVPNHSEISKGTLRSIIRDAEMDVEEFMELL